MASSDDDPTNGPEPKGPRRCRKVRPPWVTRAAFAGFAVIFGLAGLICLVIFVVALASVKLVPTAVGLGLTVVAGGLTWMMVNLTRREGQALTMTVCPGAIAMSRRGRATDTIKRHEIGLVVIQTAGRAGVMSFDVFGPDRSLVGSWDPNWGPAGPIRAMRALRHLRYPWVLHDMVPVVGKGQVRSKLAPSWTDEVVG